MKPAPFFSQALQKDRMAEAYSEIGMKGEVRQLCVWVLAQTHVPWWHTGGPGFVKVGRMSGPGPEFWSPDPCLGDRLHC